MIIRPYGWRDLKQKSPSEDSEGLWYWATTYSPTCRAVPSARSGLTSLFGMGRGVPRRYNHRNLFSAACRCMGLTH